ncbi:MAG: protein kinase [Terriglobales bacterium]
MTKRTSRRFGRYEILSELGRGAMGIVYKARDPKINRIVAVKTISLAGQPAEDEQEYRERFYREAEAAGRVSHPGIVTIFDVGEETKSRTPYIVMEFVSGQSLDKLLSKGDRKLSVETALQLALELAEALDCAHRQGVVHRDLKPANILMAEDGHVKITDFGVAKLNLSNHTLAGRALGTPAFMSPEQLNGDAVDGRSDLFSLGVILYTVLTGHRPFQGNSTVTVSFRVVNREPIPATLLDTELPQGLDHIIGRAMAKDPAERYQRGAEMVQDIQNLVAERAQDGRVKHASSPAPGVAALPAPEKPQSPAAGKLASNEPAPRQPAPHRPPPGQPALAQPVASASAPRHLTSGAPHPHALLLGNDALRKIRQMSLVGVLIVTGLFILGLWVISFGPHRVRPRAAGPLRPADTIGPVKTTPPPPPPEIVAASKAMTPAPVAKQLSKPSKPHRTDAPPVKVARAALPVVSRALTPSVTAVVTPVVSKVAAPVVVSPATLEIEVDHNFEKAHLSIWVDDKLTYTRVLEGTDKKRLGVFHHVQGRALHAMQLLPGKHRLRVRVTSGADAGAATQTASGAPDELPTYDQSAFVDGDFTSGQESVLQITCKKQGEITLNLQ